MALSLHRKTVAVVLSRHAATWLFVAASTLGASALSFGADGWVSATQVPPEPQSAAETASGLSLDELIAVAESASPQLRQAAQDVEIARGKAQQAGLYKNPTFTTGAMQLNGNQSQYFAQLSQEIITRHKLQLEHAAACRELYQADLRYLRVRFQLLTAVRQGYFSTLVAQRRLAALDELVTISHRSETAAVKFEEAGLGTRGETLLLTIEMEKAEAGRENVETALNAARRQLAAVIGERALDVGEVRGDVAISLAEFGPHVLADGYVPYNAEVQIAEQEVERARLLAQRARVEPFPNVTISAGYMYQVAPLHNYGLLEVSVPLPLWNRNQGNIYAAQAAVHRAADTVEQVQNDLAKQVAEAAGRFRQADQLVKRYQDRILPKAQESVRLVQTGLQAGEGNLLRLLTSQRSLVEAELAYLSALEARWFAAADLAGVAQVEAFP